MIKLLRGIWNGLKAFFQMIQLFVQYLGQGLSFLWSGFAALGRLFGGMPAWLVGILMLCLVLGVVMLILGRS